MLSDKIERYDHSRMVYAVQSLPLSYFKSSEICKIVRNLVRDESFNGVSIKNNTEEYIERSCSNCDKEMSLNVIGKIKRTIENNYLLQQIVYF